MQNRSDTFGEEVADQVGIFLAVVTGFIVAQGWNHAILHVKKKHRTEKNEDWYVWVYAIIATVAALIIMTCWGYFVGHKLYKKHAQQDLQKLQKAAQQLL